MNRFRTLAAASVATFILLAACGEESTSAATVNDREISQDDLIAELEAIEANEAYVSLQEENGQTVFGPEEGTFDAAFVSQVLRLRILYSVVESELDERGVEVADACREAGTSLAEQSVGGAEVLDSFTEDYREELVDRQADIAALSAELSGYSCLLEGDEGALEAYFAANEDSFEPLYCVSVIQVADQAAADDAVAQLSAGADFAELASAVSTDPQLAASGGEVGCLPAAQLSSVDPGLATLAEGERSGPIDVGGPLVIIQMDEVQPASLETQREAVVSAIGEEVDAAFGAWAEEAFAAAEVDLDDRYGTWDAESLEITRPTDDSAPDTTLPEG